MGPVYASWIMRQQLFRPGAEQRELIKLCYNPCLYWRFSKPTDGGQSVEQSHAKGHCRIMYDDLWQIVELDQLRGRES